MNLRASFGSQEEIKWWYTFWFCPLILFKKFLFKSMNFYVDTLFWWSTFFIYERYSSEMILIRRFFFGERFWSIIGRWTSVGWFSCLYCKLFKCYEDSIWEQCLKKLSIPFSESFPFEFDFSKLILGTEAYVSIIFSSVWYLFFIEGI